jgi:hypothetical protein
VALAKQSSWDHTRFNVVYEGADAKDLAVANPKPAKPDFDMAVVVGVNGTELRRWLGPLVAQLASLTDWTNLMSSNPAGPALQKVGGAWQVRAFDKGAQGYGYLPVSGLAEGAAVVADLDKLYAALEKGQEARMTGAAEGASTVKNSALWGTADRYVWVYGRSGRLERLNFGEVEPKFALATANAANNQRTGDSLTKVKAADVRTYQVVAPWYWLADVGTPAIGQDGVVTTESNLEANSQGFAYVRSDQLVKP